MVSRKCWREGGKTDNKIYLSIVMNEAGSSGITGSRIWVKGSTRPNPIRKWWIQGMRILNINTVSCIDQKLQKQFKSSSRRTVRLTDGRTDLKQFAQDLTNQIHVHVTYTFTECHVCDVRSIADETHTGINAFSTSIYSYIHVILCRHVSFCSLSFISRTTLNS